jgi:NADH-quinone oxidoreductase subunit L
MHVFTVQLPKLVPAGFVLLLLPLIPLVAAAALGLGGQELQARLGRRAVHTLALAAMLAATAVAAWLFLRLRALAPDTRVMRAAAFPILHIGTLRADLALLLDPLSALLALVVTGVGTLIHIYAIGLMAEEPAYWRFFAYLDLFVAALLLLVLGDGFVTMLIGWEGAGLCAFLLIAFWYTEHGNASAGVKAFLVGHAGDAALLVAVGLLFWGLGGYFDAGFRVDREADDVVHALRLRTGKDDLPPPGVLQMEIERIARIGEPFDVTVGPTLSFRELTAQLLLTERDTGLHAVAERLRNKRVWGVPLVLLVGLGLFLGAAGKAAQIPLYTWLPDATVAPTPVSALIQAAMVAAGVYLLARLDPLLALSPAALTIIAVAGALTALAGAGAALVQYDLKKVLAYGATSQVGFMFLALGAGATAASALQLTANACTQACLLLAAGSIVHAAHHLIHTAAPAPDGPRDPRLLPDPRDPQDMRNLGGLRQLLPATHRAYLVGSLALIGCFPFLSFFAIDAILWQAFTNRGTLLPGWLLWAIGLLASGCTALYAFRSYFMTFWFHAPSPGMAKHADEPDGRVTWVLGALSVACLAGGVTLGWPRHGALAEWLEPSLLVAHPFAQTTGTVELGFTGLNLLVAAFGVGVAYALYKDRDRDRDGAAVGAPNPADSSRLGRRLHILDFWVNALGYITRSAARLSGEFERWIVDGGVAGLSEAALAGGRRLRKHRIGPVHHYAAIVAIGAGLLVALACLAR